MPTTDDTAQGRQAVGTERDPPGTAEVVGKLDADRLCQHCLHQTHGSLVYRDARLGLLYIRCTECGSPSAVTEYPQSWRWLRRIGVVVAAMMALLGLAILTGDVAASAITGVQVASEATYPLADSLERVGLTRDPNANWIMPPGLAEDTAAVATAFSDPIALRDTRSTLLVMLIPLTIVGAITGMLWTALLLHRGLRWALLVQLLPLALATAFGAIGLFVEQPIGNTSWTYRGFAIHHLGWPYFWFAIGWLAAVRLVISCLGRPLIRLFLWVVVPKRIRLAVAGLWSDAALRI